MLSQKAHRRSAEGPTQKRRGGADEAPAPTDLAGAGYNAQGLPEAMALGGAEGETTLTYRYTASGQRTYKKAEGSEATRYVRDGSATLAVVTGGSLKHWTLTLPGGEVIGRVGSSGSSRRYYLKDHLGSIRAVLDGGGGVRETRDYYPFGLPMPGRYEKGSPPTQEDYTGHVKDEATGLHYAGARYYSSAFGRWTTTDPLADKNFADSPYAYAVNNPLRYVDPTGRDTTAETESGDYVTIQGEGDGLPSDPEGILVTAEKPNDSQSSGASSSGGPRTPEFLDAGIRASEWLQEGGTGGFTGGLVLTVAGGALLSLTGGGA